MFEDKSPKKVLLVEDEEEVMEALVRILSRFEGEVEPLRARNAGEALTILRGEMPVDAMVLDLMMPYGDAQEELVGATDPELDDTGVRLLAWLRNNHPPRGQMWVGVVTARIQHSVLRHVEELLGDRGQLYLKPFSSFLLQHHLALALGIESRVPPVLLP